MKIAIIHLGAREYYSIPRMLLGQGHDVRVFTDLYRKGFAGLLASFSKQMSRRFHPALPPNLVRHYPRFSMEYSRAREKAASAGEMENVFHQFGEKFALSCLPALRQFAPDVIISFSTTAAEIFQEFKGKSHLILNQIDGGIEEDRIVQREREKFPDWETPAPDVLGSGAERHSRELELADAVVVNSAFSKGCLEAAGVSEKKISIIPLAYESGYAPLSFKKPDKKVKLIFLGSVCLRKGIHYLDQALDILKKSGFDFSLSIAGSSSLLPQKLDELKRKYHYLGNLPKYNVHRLLTEHDILVLPSISEGFGMVQLEALSAGCRVLTTLNAGEVVNSDLLGRVVSPYSAEQIAQAIGEIKEEMNQVSPENFKEVVAKRLQDFLITQIAKKWEAAIRRGGKK